MMEKPKGPSNIISKDYFGRTADGFIERFSKETNKSIPTFVEPINCKNCGAPNRIYKCSYCGT